MSRDSEFLVKGGAKYAYAQIASDLSEVLIEDFQLKPDQFKIAVIGIGIGSEHEDSCCVTIELSQKVRHIEPILRADFVERAKRKVSKGTVPSFVW